MKLWTVSAGRHGEQEQICIDNSIITIGWDDLPNLKKFKTRDELYALPSKFQPVIHIGKLIGNYQYDNKINGIVHYRQVK